FMATFLYLCLVFLVTHQDAHTTFIPQVSLITAWFLVVASFGFLIYYSHRIAASIQNPDMVARIVDDLRPTLLGAHAPGPGQASGGPALAEDLPPPAAEGHRVPCRQSGYVQEIDHAALVDAAARADAVIDVLYRPGQFVLRGEPLACAYAPRRLTEF